ncbi:MAG: DUF1800 family protein [Phycisphaerales bacterium]|nr:DUF1800 family protein [Phycisphaerales bacterium]
MRNVLLRYRAHVVCIAGALVALTLGGCPAAPGPDGGGNPLDPNIIDGGGGGAGGGGGGGGGGSGGAGGGGTNPDNKAPIATVRVSPATGIVAGTVVTLDASGSTDEDGDELTFEWAQTDGDDAKLDAADKAVVTFAAPPVLSTGAVTFEVTVSDGQGGSATAKGTVTVSAGGEFGGFAQTSLPYRDNLTTDEAYHLLRRAAFGATPAQVDAAVRNGLTKTVDDLLTIRSTPQALLDLADARGYSIPQRWLIHLIEGPNPLNERVALFWHDRFASSARVLEGVDRSAAVGHMEMLRRNALGDYRQFLIDLTLDPLMLIWLDGANSPKDSPNENYAREFWELFTLGRDNLYTEADIKESTKAFTGITLLRQSGQDTRPIFDIVNHDTSSKHFFADRTTPGDYDYLDVIDLTLEQPEAAQYVARNLFVCFVHDHPSDDVVDELANLFIDSGFQIKPLVRRILMSQAMFSGDARGAQISSPVEHYVGIARTLDMHMDSEDSQGYVLDRVADELNGAGMALLNPPGVEGWHEDEGWLQDQWIRSRVNAFSRTMEYGPDRTPYLPYHLLPDRSRWNLREVRREIVNALAAIFHLKLSDEETELYIDVLDQDGHTGFDLVNPNDQPRHVLELLRLMAMREDVMGR